MGDVAFSLVIPVFNEEAVLPLLLRRLNGVTAALGASTEIIFVDDGSADATAAFLSHLARGDQRFRYLRLSRNFGHQIAVTAGLEAATGEAVIVMDADLQDPPEVVLEMVAKWREGYEVVNAQRLSRAGEGVFKRSTSYLFYRLMDRLSALQIPRDVGDFRLVDRVALDAFLQMPEYNRYVRGMFSWVGFRQATITYEREARAAGASKYPLRKMLGLALNALVSFSDAPLRLSIWMGAIVSIAGAIYAAYVFVRALFWTEGLVEGWASTIIVVTILAGANMLVTGIVGLYTGRIYAEVKGRPLYIVSHRIGFEAASQSENRPQRRASA